MKILSFGEIIWDVYPNEKYIGGAPFNFSAHAKRAGATAFLMSCVGADVLGTDALKMAEDYGVNTDLVAVTNAHPTGVCNVTLDQNKIPTYAIADNVAYDHIPFSPDVPRELDALAFGTLALRHTQNRATIDSLLQQGNFKQVFTDLNVRPPFDRAESIRFALERATILKVSDEELPTVLARLGGAYQDVEKSVALFKSEFPNIHTVVVTCGERPSIVYDLANGKRYECASQKTEVVSTVGAGDCYGAFFLVSYLAGEPIEACMSKAAKAAAFVVAHAEAIPVDA